MTFTSIIEDLIVFKVSDIAKKALQLPKDAIDDSENLARQREVLSDMPMQELRQKLLEKVDEKDKEFLTVLAHSQIFSFYIDTLF